MSSERILDMWLLILSFILGIVTDFVWAAWGKAVSKHMPITAANLSILIFCTGLFYTVLIINNDWWAIFVYLIGAWFGTYISVKYCLTSKEKE